MFCSAWYTASTLSSMLSCFSSMESLEMSNRATLLPADSLALKVSLHTTITCAICSETCTISVCICCNASLMALTVAPVDVPVVVSKSFIPPD